MFCQTQKKLYVTEKKSAFFLTYSWLFKNKSEFIINTSTRETDKYLIIMRTTTHKKIITITKICRKTRNFFWNCKKFANLGCKKCENLDVNSGVYDVHIIKETLSLSTIWDNLFKNRTEQRHKCKRDEMREREIPGSKRGLDWPHKMRW